MKVNKKINLAQLDVELNGKGLNGILDNFGNIIEVTLTENNDATEAELKAAIDVHIAIDTNVAKEAAVAKLTALGLTADDLKALGLGNN
jgi:hypothetical protein